LTIAIKPVRQGQNISATSIDRILSNINPAAAIIKIHHLQRVKYSEMSLRPMRPNEPFSIGTKYLIIHK